MNWSKVREHEMKIYNQNLQDFKKGINNYLSTQHGDEIPMRFNS